MYKRFKIYFFADIITHTYISLNSISLSWHIIKETNSNLALSKIITLGIISSFLTNIFFGIIIDYFRRKQVLLYTILFQIICVGLCICFFDNKDFKPYYIYYLAISNGVLFSIYLPTSRAYLKELFFDKNQLNIYSMVEFNMQFSMLVSGLIGGGVYNQLGLKGILVLNLIMLIVSFVLFWYTAPVKSLDNKIKKNYFLQDSLKGFYFLYKTPAILIFIVTMLIPMAASSALQIVNLRYVLDYLHGNSSMFSILASFYSIGGILAGLVFSIYMHKYNVKIICIYLFIGSIISSYVLSLNHSLHITCITTCFIGLFYTPFRIILSFTIAQNVPGVYMGRVLSSVSALLTIFQICVIHYVRILMDLNLNISGYLCMTLITLVSFILYIISYKKLEY